MDNKPTLTSRTISGLFWKFLERIGAQLITTIVSIILARILLPEDYGIVSLVTIVITICNVFVSSGFGNALIQKNDADDVDFSSVFYCSFLLSIILYIILYFAAPLIAEFYNNDAISIILRVMGIRLPIAAINSVQQAYVARNMLFKKFFFSTLFGTLISGIVGIILAYRNYGVWALVAQYLVNVCIDTVILSFTVKWRPKLVFSWKRVKKLLSYGWKLLGAGLLDTIYDQIRSLVIGKKYSSADLAYYEKGRQFPSLITNNINASMNSVLLSSMSKIQDDKSKIKLVTQKSMRVSAYVVMPLMVGLACVAEPFVRCVLTDKWLPMVPYLQIMCFVYALYPVHTANLTAIQAIGRSDLYLILEIIKKFIGIGSLLIAMFFGVFWIAISALITTVLSACINAFPNKVLLRYGFFEQLKDIISSTWIAIVMGVSIYFLKYLPINLWIVLLLQIMIGMSIYIGISLLTKNKEFIFILKTIKSYFHRDKI